jgi:hypothetical protein
MILGPPTSVSLHLLRETEGTPYGKALKTSDTGLADSMTEGPLDLKEDLGANTFSL